MTKRRAEFGWNQLPSADREVGAWSVVRRQLDNPLLLLLAAAGGVSLYLGELVDAGVILAAILGSIGFGFIQEFKAVRTLAALRRLVAPQAWVIRQGKRTRIPAAAVVPDDLLLVAAGDKLAADGVLVSAAGLEVSEAALTGESVGISKVAGDSVSAGTVVVRGSGVVRVTAIGATTAMGQIAKLVEAAGAGTTPLENKLARLARQFSLLLSLLAGLVLLLSLAQGRDLPEALVVTLALAVAVIPEGLPIMVTVMLAAGMERLARKQAHLRRLSAVETLGSVTVAAIDKTGTLTSGALRVAEIIGPDPEAVIRTALLASDIGLLTLATPDQLELALAEHGRQLGIDVEALHHAHPRLDAQPFDAAKRLMASLVRADQTTQLVVKGAPEVVLPACRMTRAARGGLTKTIRRLTEAGHRVIAVAKKSAGGLEAEPTNLTLMGVISLIDPPREGAAAALAELTALGIRPLIITGDHPATARRVAVELGLHVTQKTVVTGELLRRLSPTARADRLRRVHVVARVLPADKLSIVEALQKSGEIVAMTGDGVNDGPALKAANIGVAMGESGTEVAKETADLILLDDHLRTIVAAVLEGRTIVRNLQKGIIYLLGTNIAELILVVTALALGWPLPITATQILWVNLVTDTLPVVGLAFEVSLGARRYGPSPARANLLSPLLVRRILVMGLATSAACLWLFALANPTLASSGPELIVAQTVTFTSLAVLQLGLAFTVRAVVNLRLPWRHLRWPLPVAVAAGFGLQLLAITALTPWLGTMPLPPETWTILGFGLLAVVAVVEMHKLIERRLGARG